MNNIITLRLKDGSTTEAEVDDSAYIVMLKVHPSLLDVFSQERLTEMARDGYKIFYNGRRFLPVLLDEEYDPFPIAWISVESSNMSKVVK